MFHKGTDRFYLPVLVSIASVYVGLIVLLLGADVFYMIDSALKSAEQGASWLETLKQHPIVTSLAKEEIRYAIQLTLFSCTASALLAVIVGVPAGYLLSRKQMPFWRIADVLMDIPIVLPPLVIGLSLLILFQYWPFTIELPGGKRLNTLIVYQVPAVILAQFTVATAFSVRTMKVAFDKLSPRCEQVALTLGCSRFQSFFRVVLPEVCNGIFSAGTIAWARSLGEFGPLLIFAGATRRKTEVLSTTVFLELSIGNLSAAVAVSLYMVAAAVVTLLCIRHWETKMYGNEHSS